MTNKLCKNKIAQKPMHLNFFWIEKKNNYTLSSKYKNISITPTEFADRFSCLVILTFELHSVLRLFLFSTSQEICLTLHGSKEETSSKMSMWHLSFNSSDKQVLSCKRSRWKQGIHSFLSSLISDAAFSILLSSHQHSSCIPLKA